MASLFPNVHGELNMIKRVLVAYCTATLLSAAYLPAQAQTQSPAPQAVQTTAVSKDEVQKFANAIKQILVVNLSGRGDKDIFTVHDILKARGEI